MANESLSTTRWLATGILVCCVVAVILGVIHTSNQSQQTALVDSDSEDTPLAIGGGEYLAKIDLSGMIVESEDDGGFIPKESSAVIARNLLHKAAKDPNVKGVLLRVNTPGGTVGMSQELYHAVETVRKQKPIVVSMGDVAASGGYYTAAAADKIVANPGTLTASIGVIIHGMNMQELLNSKLGVKPVTYKSGQFKDILSPYRAATPAEQAMLQKLVNDSYQQFLNAVITGRTHGVHKADKKQALIAQIKSVADGRVLIGTEAKRMGLVDELGGLDEATHILEKRAIERFDLPEKKKIPLKEYHTGSTFFDLLGVGAFKSIHPVMLPSFQGQVNLQDAMRFMNQPLWLME